MSLQQRAREAYLKQLTESREQEQRRLLEHYQATANASTIHLSAKLQDVLGVTPKEVRILKGPGGQGVALYLEDGLAFATDGDNLVVTTERTDEPYPDRKYWHRISSLERLGQYLQDKGPAVAEPEGVKSG